MAEQQSVAIVPLVTTVLTPMPFPFLAIPASTLSLELPHAQTVQPEVTARPLAATRSYVLLELSSQTQERLHASAVPRAFTVPN